MSKFAIYNYNFLRIIEPHPQMQLDFPGWADVDVEESFGHRQQLLDELLLADYAEPYPFENARKKRYWHRQIVKPQDGVYVMRVANVTRVTITDENLHDSNYTDYRNCLVIIDNRPGIQRIAIEQRSKAFRETKTVAHILEASLSKLLAPRRLKVMLTAVYDSRIFWNTVQQYPQGFSKVRFHLPPLNLERLARVMDRYLTEAREDWDSDLDFSFGAGEGGVLKIDPDNPRQRALIEGASAAGGWIVMKPKGENRPVCCGKNEFVVYEIDRRLLERLTAADPALPGLEASPMDDVKRIMKEIPDVPMSAEKGDGRR